MIDTVSRSLLHSTDVVLAFVLIAPETFLRQERQAYEMAINIIIDSYEESSTVMPD